jgi:hypothetical protein
MNDDQPAGGRMPIRWINLDARGEAALVTRWEHRIPPHARILRCTAFGDAFLESPDGGVHWLNTGTAECMQVAVSRLAFEQAIAEEGEAPASWLLPTLVDALEAEGKVLADGQCYTYAILPIFAEGKFEPWNFRPVPAWEHFEVTADLHRQLEGMPDRSRVRLRIE